MPFSRELELDLSPLEFERCGDGAADGALSLVLEVMADDVLLAKVLHRFVDGGDDESEHDDAADAVRDEERAADV
jgi:hypothetical protein